MVVVMVVMVAASCASDRRGSGLHAADTRGAADKRGAAMRRCPPFRNVAMLPLPAALRIIAFARDTVSLMPDVTVPRHAPSSRSGTRSSADIVSSILRCMAVLRLSDEGFLSLLPDFVLVLDGCRLHI
jgi:hypothetical protein